MNDDPALDIVRRHSLWFEPTAEGMSPLLEAIGDARLVLIGEATHGTHQCYRTRAELTKALISAKGFNLVAVEADWPDAYRVNRWVRHDADEAGAAAALEDFTRFPRGLIDETSALEPLERWARDEIDLPETHPSGI